MKSFAKIMIMIILIISIMIPASFICYGLDTEYEYYVEDGKAVLTKYLGNSKSVVVPSMIDGYEVIKTENTFLRNEEIKKVVIEKGVTIIGKNTFYNCRNLKKVIIPDTVHTLDRYAFAYTNIKTIRLPAETHYINEGCFCGCESLKTVVSKAKPLLDNGTALYIGEYAFARSGIEVIKTDYAPQYDSNSFTNNCLFSDSIIIALVSENLNYSAIREYIRCSTPLMRAFIVMLCCIIFVGLFCGGIAVLRFFLSVLGKSRIANYKKYSKNIFTEIDFEKKADDIVHYRKIIMSSDTAKRNLKIVVALIIALGYLEFGLFLLGIFSDSHSISFLNNIIFLFAYFLLSIVLLWIIYKLYASYSEHKDKAGKPQVKIKKIKKWRYDR